MIDLTPLEVRKKKSDFRRVMRGYDPASVDDFLDLVADRLDELVRENAALSERTTRQEQQVTEFRERERALTEALVTAQEMREEIRRQTTREAEESKQATEQETAQLRERTVEEVARLRSSAESEAAQLREEAAREAAQLRSAAAEEAAQLRAKAQAESSQLRTTAQQESQELRTSVRQEREREEKALRRVRAQQQEFLATAGSFLERALAELRAAAAAMAGPASAAGAAEPGSEAAEAAAAGFTAGLAAGLTAVEVGSASPEVGVTDEDVELAVDALLLDMDAPGEAAAAADAPAGSPEVEPSEAVPGAAEAPSRSMFPDDPIEDDELSFVDELAPFSAAEFEPFEPEPYEPEPYEPEPEEIETAEASEREAAAEPPLAGAEDTYAAGAYGLEPVDHVPLEGPPSDVTPSGSPDMTEDALGGPVGLGGLDEPQQWASAPSWHIEGVDLVPESGATSEVPLPAETGDEAEPPAGDTEGAVDLPMLEDEDDEAASEILRNAAAAGYDVPELEEGDELLLDDAVIDEADGEDDGWLPTLLEDDR
jgi:DivIVA domain-containing protein